MDRPRRVRPRVHPRRVRHRPRHVRLPRNRMHRHRKSHRAPPHGPEWPRGM